MPEFKRSLAVVIGINQYDANNGIPKLETAVHDAKELAFILAKKYQYQVLPLLNTDATQSRLDSLLAAFTQKMLPLLDGSKVQIEPDDYVLFYFAGHGIALDGLDNAEGPAGYLVPQDARLDDSSSLLPMQRLHDALIQLPCRHLLIILDCCFAGTFRWAGLHRDVVRSQKMYLERYERFTSGCAQQVITSAAYDEKALDSLYRFGQRGQREGHSPFADLLLKALNGTADLTQDGVLTATELYVYLYSELGKLTAKQTPELCQLKGHDKGEYIFFSPDFVEEKLEKAPSLDEGSNPYRGLEPFDEAHKELFFGRQQVINELYTHLFKREKQPLTVVLGASGTGKSSLVKAGLLPRLREKQWQIIEPLRPGKSPFTALAKAVLQTTNAITKDDLNCINVLSDKLRRAPQNFTEMVSLGNNSEQKLILVIDQFEELVTMCQPKEQQQFLSWLKTVLVSSLERLHVVITLRSDFEPLFSSVLLERSEWMTARFDVPPMTQDELREVIEKPAAEAVMYFEPPKLVDRLINDVVQMPGALPLLSFTLSELYLKYLQRRDNNRAMTQKDYKQLGGVMGSLTKRATEEYEELVKLDPANEQTVRRVMLRMVSMEGGESARRRVPRTELVYRDAEENNRVEQVIQAFSEARLIVEGTNSQDERCVEPAHDALVRGWDKLQQWKIQEQANSLLQRELTPDANNWAANKKQAVGILWDNDYRLDRVRQVFESNSSWLNSLESDFVERSIQRRRINRGWAIGGVVTAFVIVLGFASIQKTQNLDAQIKASSASSEVLLASKKELDALIESLRAGRQLKRRLPLNVDTRIQALTALQQTVYGIRERNRLEGHSSIVRRVSSSRDGQLLVSASDDGTVKLWKQDGKLLKTIPVDSHSVNSVNFSPDDQMFASANFDGTVKLWSRDGHLLRTLKGHKGNVLDISFSPDGQLLAAVAANEVRLWNRDGTLLKILPKNSDGVSAISFSPDGNKLTDDVNAISFSPDSQTFASASRDGALKLWSRDGRLLKTWKGHNNQVSSVSFNLDGQTLVSSCVDGTITLWSRDGRKLKTWRGHNSPVSSVSFSPDGRFLASASSDKTVKLWSRDGQLIRTIQGHTNWVTSVIFSPDGHTLVSTSADTTAKLWSIEGREPQTLKGFCYYNEYFGMNFCPEVSFSPNGKTIATAGDGNTVKLWSRDGTLLKTFKVHGDRVTDVRFSPDGKILASASYDGTVKLWNPSGGESKTLKMDTVIALGFSPNSETIITAHGDDTIKLWNRNGTIQKTIPWKSYGTLAVSFSPDGKTLAATGESLGGENKSVKLWNLNGSKPKSPKNRNRIVWTATFSPNGKTIALATADNTVELWNLNGGNPTILKGHTERVRGISFSPDGQTIASASEDKTVKLWSRNGREIKTLKGHKERVISVSFSPDGKILTSTGTDGTVILWNLDLDDLLGRGCYWVHDYLATNSNVGKENSHICNGIKTAPSPSQRPKSTPLPITPQTPSVTPSVPTETSPSKVTFQTPSPTPKQTVSLTKNYIGLRYADADKVMPPGFEIRSSGIIRDDKVDPLADPEYGITQLSKGLRRMLWLKKFVSRNLNGNSIWEVIDVLDVPEVGKEEELIISKGGDSCYLNGKPDAKIVAIFKVEPGKRYALEYYTKARKAWRVNLKTHKFEEILPRNVSCRNPVFGI